MSRTIIRRVETQPNVKSRIQVVKVVKPQPIKEEIEFLPDGSVKTTKGGNVYISRCVDGGWIDEQIN